MPLRYPELALSHLPAGDPPSYRRWGIQLAEWVTCVIAARALCGGLVVLLGPVLAHGAKASSSSARALACKPHTAAGLAVVALLSLSLPCRAESRTFALPPLCRAWIACLRGTPLGCSSSS